LKRSRRENKPLAWRHGEIKTPPFSAQARIRAGLLLRLLQGGERLEMPHSRPMPVIGPRCAELRIPDETVGWRIIYRMAPDAIVVLAVFRTKTARTPRRIIDECRRRLREYDHE